MEVYRQLRHDCKPMQIGSGTRQRHFAHLCAGMQFISHGTLLLQLNTVSKRHQRCVIMPLLPGLHRILVACMRPGPALTD